MVMSFNPTGFTTYFALAGAYNSPASNGVIDRHPSSEFSLVSLCSAIRVLVLSYRIGMRLAVLRFDSRTLLSVFHSVPSHVFTDICLAIKSHKRNISQEAV